MMKMYAISVAGGMEKAVAEEINKSGLIARVPSTLLQIRNRGCWYIYEKILIPGYVFMDLGRLTPKIYYTIKKMAYVSGWIGKGDPLEMIPEDREFINILSNNGKPIPLINEHSDLLKNASCIDIRKRQKRIYANICIMGKDHKITFGMQ